MDSRIKVEAGKRVVIRETLIYSEAFGGIMTASEYEGSDEQREDGPDDSHVYLAEGTEMEATEEGWFEDVEWLGGEHTTSLILDWVSFAQAYKGRGRRVYR